MRIAQEEILGPLTRAIPFTDIKQGIDRGKSRTCLADHPRYSWYGIA